MPNHRQSRSFHRGNENHNTQRLIRYLDKNTHLDKTVIFEFGTKAARVLVGPTKVSSSSWSRYHFFNDAVLTHLGAELDFNKQLQKTSPGIITLINFINHYRPLLLKSNISPRNFHGVGTAVFRWLRNKSDILLHILQQTGLKIKILSAEEEARLSLLGVATTHNMRRSGKKLPDSKNHILLLLDQGGGSMEVSYTSTNRSESGVKNFDDLGTIALRDRFLTTSPTGNMIDPQHNQNRISDQHKRILKYVERRINEWQGYPELEGKTIHAYALGSAASTLLRGSNYDIHNRIISKQSMFEQINKHNQMVQQNNQQIASFYKQLQAQQNNNKKRQQEEQLLLLYGLPVYTRVLKKFAIEDMRMCGYGLRYGVFVAQNRFNAKI